MGETFFYRVWPLRRPTPGESKPLPTGGLPLDRELMGVGDNSLSRAANAPVLRPRGAVLDLYVNPKSARLPLLFEGQRFEDFQHRLPLKKEPWQLPPGLFGDPMATVRSKRGTLALVPLFHLETNAASHALLSVGPSTELSRGHTATLTAPSTLVLGNSAIEVVPEETGVPPAKIEGQLAPGCWLLALNDVELRLSRGEQLEGLSLPPADHAGEFKLPGSPGPEPYEAAIESATRLLGTEPERWLFLPALKDDRLPRLAFAYTSARSGNTTAKLFLSGREPTELVTRLRDHLEHMAPSVGVVGPAMSVEAGGVTAALEPTRFGALETKNPRFAATVAKLASVAEQDISVLLLGESGTGKEFLAGELHRHSKRKHKSFVTVNCAAIPPHLIESELFGHVKGAFTGADHERPGAFVAADGGTLFLDEVGDAPLPVQVALLRALEARKIKPVGLDRERSVDVRLIAATSQRLKQLVDKKSFRTDLYYRLEQVSVRVPPLRERPEDIPALCRSILRELAPRAELTFEALHALTRHPYYGNVRELKNVLYRAITLNAQNRAIGASAILFESELSETFRPPALTELEPDAPNPGVWFPQDIVDLAHQAMNEAQIPKSDEHSKGEMRTRARAALLYLKTRYPFEAWPQALLTQYARLFGDRWATTEDGRGLRALMKLLALNYRDEEARARLVGMV